MLLGRVEEGVGVLERSVPLLEAAGNLGTLAIALNNLAANHISDGDLRLALERGRQALDIHGRVGNTASIGFVDVTLGGINMYLGEWDEAELSIERGASVLKSVGASWFAPYAPLHRGQLSLGQGRWEEARHELNEAIVLAEPIGELQSLGTANWLLAELDIREGRPGAACSRLQPLVGNNGPYLALLLTSLAWSQLAMGDSNSAVETADRALALAGERHQRLWVPHIYCVQGMILTRQKRWEEAQRVFEEAVSMARSMPYPYAEGRALYEQGLMYKERGLNTEAEATLTEALEIFRRLGAQKDAEITELELTSLIRPVEPAR
jgi:tetratricopeptide (TPR) repeat protein